MCTLAVIDRSRVWRSSPGRGSVVIVAGKIGSGVPDERVPGAVEVSELVLAGVGGDAVGQVGEPGADVGQVASLSVVEQIPASVILELTRFDGRGR